MNRSVCEACRRFQPDVYKRSNFWMCAKNVHLEVSDVIPGHSYVERNDFHFMSEDVLIHPEWCERPLEQTVVSPDEKVELKPDGNVVFDGNDEATRKHQDVLAGKARRFNGQHLSLMPWWKTP